MAIEIKKPRDVALSRGIKALVHGPAGAGKTVLCATGQMPTLIISAEGGLLSIQDAPDNIDTVEVGSIDQIREVYSMLEQGSDYKLVCLDSLTEIAEVVLAYEKGQTKDPRQAYGALIDEMGHLVRAFRDLPAYHVLMTSKQERIKDENNGSMLYIPSMPGSKVAQQLPYWFDLVFAYRVEKNPEGETVRWLQTERDGQHEAKDRSGKLDDFEVPDMAVIISKILGNTVQATQAA
ncbi:MAG: ATP-binding protein [Halieaceae bacterium]|nr:ATP-binding protein [Halieaceae bacterium]